MRWATHTAAKTYLAFITYIQKLRPVCGLFENVCGIGHVEESETRSPLEVLKSALAENYHVRVKQLCLSSFHDIVRRRTAGTGSIF